MCQRGHFACNRLYCIPENWTCDGEDDCLDFSDESHCNSNPNVIKGKGIFIQFKSAASGKN